MSDKKQNIKGNNNNAIIGNNNNIEITNNHYHEAVNNILSKKPTIQFMPNPDIHISSEQAKKIQDKISEIVEIEFRAGIPKKKLYKKWYGHFNNAFNLTRYDSLSKDKFEEALEWLGFKKNKEALPKIRRKDNNFWRNNRYKSIYAKLGNLNKSKEWLYALVEERLGVKITSLKDLGERNLDKLYRIMRAL